MPKLAPTKYRAFYLVNNGVCNRDEDEFLWDLDVDRSNPEVGQVNRYTRIRATIEGNFGNVTIHSCRVEEVCGRKTISDVRADSWDDVDQDIIDIVDDFYDSDDGYRRRRLEGFADSVQRLVEDPTALTFEILDDGGFEVRLNGFPYFYDSGKDRLDFSIWFRPFEGDYHFEYDSGFDYEDMPDDFTERDMTSAFHDAKRYHEVSDGIDRLFHFSDIYDDEY